MWYNLFIGSGIHVTCISKFNLLKGISMNDSKLSIDNTAEAVCLEKVTGEMQFTFTNDYMFRAVLQESTNALKGLLCAVLGMETDQIAEIQVLNPIELGKSMGLKDFVLDTRVLLNNHM